MPGSLAVAGTPAAAPAAQLNGQPAPTAAPPATAAARDAPAPRPPRRRSRRRAHGAPRWRPPRHGRGDGARRGSACNSSSAASGCSSPSSCRCSPSARPRPPGSAWSRRARSSAPRSPSRRPTSTIPARRGSITDVNGNDLAVSEPAMDIAATTYLIKDATKVAARARAADRRRRGRAAAHAGRRDSGFVYLGRGIPPTKAEQGQEAQHPRPGVHPALPPRLPARVDGRAAARQHRDRRAGPRRARVPARQAAQRHRRRAPAGQGRDGQPDRDARHQAGQARPAPSA